MWVCTRVGTGDDTVFIIFISYLDSGTECTLSRFAGNTKWGEVSTTPKVRAVIQSDCDRLEKWADRNLMRFSEGKYKVLTLKKDSSRHDYRLWGQPAGRHL